MLQELQLDSLHAVSLLSDLIPLENYCRREVDVPDCVAVLGPHIARLQFVTELASGKHRTMVNALYNFLPGLVHQLCLLFDVVFQHPPAVVLGKEVRHKGNINKHFVI